MAPIGDTALDALERASLVAVVRRGRERLHYLDPVPIHEIGERWTSEFDMPRLQAITAIEKHHVSGWQPGWTWVHQRVDGSGLSPGHQHRRRP